MSLISLDAVTKTYYMGNEPIKALRNVSISIQHNEYVAFTGSSGSGKSTMMNILGCLDTSTEGNFYLNKHDVSTLTEDRLAEIRNQEIGFIFQNFNLLPRFTALRNVMQPLIYRGIHKQQREEMALEALSRVGLSKRTGHMPNQLSGGQCQRVAIARALVTNPSILLADEPTGNLDSRTTSDIMELFDELHQSNQTIIIVTHENEIAERCRRVIQLEDGQVARDYNNKAE